MARAVFAQGPSAGLSFVFNGMEEKPLGSVETDIQADGVSYIGTWEAVLVLVPVGEI